MIMFNSKDDKLEIKIYLKWFFICKSYLIVKINFYVLICIKFSIYMYMYYECFLYVLFILCKVF